MTPINGRTWRALALRAFGLWLIYYLPFCTAALWLTVNGR